jgi:hypothetical protein
MSAIMAISGSSASRGSKDPDSRFGIRADFKVYLNQFGQAEPETGVSGWVRAHVGYAKEPDGLTLREILEKARALLELTGTRHVIGIRLGSRFVYRDSKSMREQDNREEAFAATLGSGRASDAVEVGVWSHGFTDQFEFQQDAVFRLRHSQGSPSIIITLLGIPIDLAGLPGEDHWAHFERVERVFGDRALVEQKEQESTARVQVFLREYQELLKRLFIVRQIDQRLKVDIAHSTI